MTVLPRHGDTGGSRKRPQRGMRSFSVSRATFDRIAAAAKQHGCSMADVVRAACADILDPPAA